MQYLHSQNIFLTGSKKLAALLICVFLFACSTETKEQNRPNVIVLMADDQGWGDLSFHGNLNLSTPNIDSLALNGAVLQNFYVQPVCSPTRGEFLTGIYSPKLGIYSTSAGGERLNLGETTIAEVFKKAGYATAAYGKWHNGMQPPYHPNARGFDDFYGFCSGHWGNYFSPMLEHNGKIVAGDGFLVDDFFNKGISFIEKNSAKPFFMALPVNTPHSPMQVPEVYWNKFENKNLQLRHHSQIEDDNFTKAALAMVENIDWNVGRLMKKLKELGILENTIVVYLSDNGPNSRRWNGSFKGIKGSTDEGGVKSPCFVQWEGKIGKGVQIPQITAAIDLLPTLANLANIKPETNSTTDGVDLSPLLLEKKVNWPDRVIYNHWNGKTSVRSQKYRLDHTNKLYDIENDRGQRKDISNLMPELKDSLLNLKLAWETSSLKSIGKRKTKPFTVGHPHFNFTQLPARDATGYGNIMRSNKYPNDSYLSNWVSTNDSVAWHVEVLEEGWFKVDVYHSLKELDTGVTMQLSFHNSRISKKFTQPNDPPLKGMENDRVPRIESYVKDFVPLSLGKIYLKEGKGDLVLKALEIPGSAAIDFRLLHLSRL